MKRVDEFRKKMDELLNEFSDVPYRELADELDSYASDYTQKANREEESES